MADPRQRLIEESLQLRRWALADPSRPPPPVSERAWSVFLRVERCAAWLQARSGCDSAVLDDRAMTELKRILSARAQLTRLARWAAEEALPVAVLKGGASVLHGTPLDLMDLDLLARAPVAGAVAAHLDDSGFAATNRPAAARLGNRAAANLLPVEVHTAVPGLAEAESWRWQPSALPGLSLLRPAEHLWHVLLHATLQHPERRGRIRDLLLIADARAACADDEWEQVQARLASHRSAPLLRMQLAASAALARGEPVTADPFELVAASNYAVNEWILRRNPGPRRLEWVAFGTFAAAARRSGYPSDNGEGTLDVPSARASLAWLRRVAPPAERAVRRLLRSAPEWTALPLAVPLLRRASRGVRASPAVAP